MFIDNVCRLCNNASQKKFINDCDNIRIFGGNFLYLFANADCEEAS